jgi:cytochrome b561
MAMDNVDSPALARYPRATVALHWIVAALIIVLLATGWYMVGIPKDTSPRAFFFNLHKSLGIVAAAFILALIVYRARRAAPPLPEAMPQWEKTSAVFNHRLSYVFMVLVTAAGYLTSSFSKYGPKLFGVGLPHWGWDDPALRGNFVVAHRIGALIFAVLIGIHIVAVLKHSLLDRDGVFARMR